MRSPWSRNSYKTPPRLPGRSAGGLNPTIDDDEISLTEVPCSRIAAGQVADPLHNGLVATFHHDGTKTTLNYPRDGRDRIARDTLRVCRWVTVEDRVGDTTFYGLNYRGQALIEATQSGNDLVRVIRKFNEDGNLVYKTDPHRSTAPTTYETHQYETFDEIETEALPLLRPGFWTRRNNRIRTERHFSEPQEVGTDDTPLVTGLFTSTTYEPLFNQPRVVEEGILNLSGTPQWQNRWTVDYDYQELGWSIDTDTNPLAALLFNLIGYGWEFSHVLDNDEFQLSNNYGDDDDFLRDVQFTVHLYDDDLNGDGVIGFQNNDLTGPIGGTPVRITHRVSDAPQDHRRTRFAFAPLILPPRSCRRRPLRLWVLRVEGSRRIVFGPLGGSRRPSPGRRGLRWVISGPRSGFSRSPPD